MESFGVALLQKLLGTSRPRIRVSDWEEPSVSWFEVGEEEAFQHQRVEFWSELKQKAYFWRICICLATERLKSWPRRRVRSGVNGLAAMFCSLLPTTPKTPALTTRGWSISFLSFLFCSLFSLLRYEWSERSIDFRPFSTKTYQHSSAEFGQKTTVAFERFWT